MSIPSRGKGCRAATAAIAHSFRMNGDYMFRCMAGIETAPLPQRTPSERLPFPQPATARTVQTATATGDLQRLFAGRPDLKVRWGSFWQMSVGDDLRRGWRLGILLEGVSHAKSEATMGLGCRKLSQQSLIACRVGASSAWLPETNTRKARCGRSCDVHLVPTSDHCSWAVGWRGRGPALSTCGCFSL